MKNKYRAILINHEFLCILFHANKRALYAILSACRIFDGGKPSWLQRSKGELGIHRAGLQQRGESIMLYGRSPDSCDIISVG